MPNCQTALPKSSADCRKSGTAQRNRRNVLALAKNADSSKLNNRLT